MNRLLPLNIILLLSLLFSCRDNKTNSNSDQPSATLPTKDSISPSDQYAKREGIRVSGRDFNHLQNNKDYERFFAGNLTLTTGRVVCTDPLYRELGLPQSWTAAPGNYPVYLYIALNDDFEGKVAFAELVLKDETPVRWEKSMIPDNLLKDSFDRGINGMYPVENGLSSFSDYETYHIYEQEIDSFYAKKKNGNYYTDILESYFKKNATIPASSRGEDWADYKPQKANANIIMFASGWGDGLYVRYVGFDGNGKPVKFLTDFVGVQR